jgi:hypothetical protein
MWIILIVVLVLAMMVGPVLMLQPSPRSRLQAALREKAAQMGLGVQLSPNHPFSQPEGLVFYCHSWPSYLPRARIHCWLLVHRSYAHEIHYADHWDFQGEGPPEATLAHLKTLLTTIPDGVFGVEANPAGLGVHWNEQGGEKRLEAIYHWLDDAITQIALPELPKSSGH